MGSSERSSGPPGCGNMVRGPGQGGNEIKHRLRSSSHSIFAVDFQGVVLFAKGGRQLVLNPDFIFSWSYLPCQVPGIYFSNLKCLGFERPGLPPFSPGLLFGRAGFALGRLQVSAQGPGGSS